MRKCADIAPLIDELVDGTLDAARASAVRGHARGCPPCAARLDETERLVAAARGLQPVDPPPSLWAGIQDELARQEARDAERPSWWWWLQAARPRLRLAGVGALALAVAASVIVVQRSGGGSGTGSGSRVGSGSAVGTGTGNVASAAPDLDGTLDALAQADADYTQAVAELKQIVAAERPRWSPAAARAFDENLAIIDAAVDRQRAAFQAQPQDVTTVDALHASYRKQIDFLEEAVVRGGVTEQ